MKGLIAAIIGFLLLIIFSCSNEGGGFFAKLLKGGGSAVPVTVESVVLQERSSEVRVPATVESTETMDVTLPLDVFVERIFVSEGDAVNAGDPLIRISDQEMQMRLARLRADLKEAKATLEKNSYLMKNRDRLLDEGKIDRNQYDTLDADVQTGEAAADKIQQSISRLEERLGNNTVTSPTGGIVGRINVTQGSTAQAGKAILSVTKADPVMISFKLPSSSANTIRSGQAITVRFPDLGGEGAMGKVTSVETELDAAGSFGVKAAISNPAGHFKAGMKASVIFTSPDKQRFFVIPQEALIKERYAYFVFTVSKGVAHKVQVIPNETIGDRVEIARGISEEDLVVVKGHDKLTEGTVVDIWGR